MNKKLLTSFLLTSCVLSVVSCGQKESIPEVKSLKSGLQYLSVAKNYTLTYDSDLLIAHDLIFTSNSIGTVSSYKPTVNTIYYQDGSGTYCIGNNGEKTVGGEYISGHSVWDGTLATSFLNVSKDYINEMDSDATSLTIKDKEYRMNFLKLIGFSESDYSTLGSLTASYFLGNNNQPAIRFVTTISTKEFAYIAHDFGTSVNTVVNDYIKEGKGAYKISKSMSVFQNAVQGNNYTQGIYYIGSGIVGYYGFNPNYFMEYYASSFVSTMVYGYMAINAPKQEKVGVYRYIISYDIQGKGTFELDSTKYYEKPDIVSFYNYPSNLYLLSHLEYARSWKTELISSLEYKPTGKNFIVTDATILADFSNNFNMSGSFDGQTPVCLGVDYNEITREFTFVYKFYYQNGYHIMPFYFTKVGMTNNSILDAELEKYK